MSMATTQLQQVTCNPYASRCTVDGTAADSAMRAGALHCHDLKGSTLGRTSGADAAKSGTVLKDLDLDMKLKLEEGWHDR